MLKVDPDLVIPNRDLTIMDGAIAPFANSGEGTYYQQMIESIIRDHGEKIDKPVKKYKQHIIKIYFTELVTEKLNLLMKVNLVV